MVWQPWRSLLRASTAVLSHSIFFQAANQYIFGLKNTFAFLPKGCALLHVNFPSLWEDITAFRANSEAMRFWNSLLNPFEEGNQLTMQKCSANQLEVIMPSWLPKVPSWFRKKCPLSQPIQICPGLNVNEIQIPYDKHHVVSSLVKIRQNVHNLSNMK